MLEPHEAALLWPVRSPRNSHSARQLIQNTQAGILSLSPRGTQAVVTMRSAEAAWMEHRAMQSHTFELQRAQEAAATTGPRTVLQEAAARRRGLCAAKPAEAEEKAASPEATERPPQSPN